MSQDFFSVVCLHSPNAPPVPFHAHIGGGGTTPESTLESAKEWDSKYPVCTVGYENNPEHIWEIVDYAVCESVSIPSQCHNTKGYVVLYYEPVNKEAVIRDCLPELMVA